MTLKVITLKPFNMLYIFNGSENIGWKTVAVKTDISKTFYCKFLQLILPAIYFKMVTALTVLVLSFT